MSKKRGSSSKAPKMKREAGELPAEPSPLDPSPSDATTAAAADGRRRGRAVQRDETDSFIDEVTEELQKDRLYRAFRRYGPVALGAIILLVGGTAVNEYLKSAEIEEARRVGAELTAAATAEDSATAFLGFADDAPDGPAMIALFRAAEARQSSGDVDGAVSLYEDIASNAAFDQKYRDLAEIKSAIARIDDEDPSVLVAILERLAQEGAPYRPLALELFAVAHLRMGETDAARSALEDAIAADGAPQGVVLRAQALLDALGGPIEPDEPTPDTLEESTLDETLLEEGEPQDASDPSPGADDASQTQ